MDVLNLIVSKPASFFGLSTLITMYNHYNYLFGLTFRSEEPVSKMILWAQKHGHKKPGRPALTYIDMYSRRTQDGTLKASKQQCRTVMCGGPSWIGDIPPPISK